MLDAIMFALYGKPYRNINKPQLVNSITNKNCDVEIEFKTKGKQYKVCRSIKPAKFEIYQDGKLIDQNANIKEYQEMLEKSILKLNHKSFTQIVVIGSANYMPFMQMKPADRRSVIEDLLDIEIFTKMNSILKERASNNKPSILNAKRDIELTEQKIEMTRQHAAQIASMLLKNKEDKAEEIQEYENKLKEQKKQIKTAVEKIKSLEATLPNKEKIKQKESKLKRIQNNIDFEMDSVKNQVEFFKKHDECPTCTQSIDKKIKKETLDDNLSKLDELTVAKEKLSTHFNEIFNLKKEYTAIEKSADAIRNEHVKYVTIARATEQQIDKLNREQEKVIVEESDNDTTELEEALQEQKEQYQTLLDQKEIYDISLSLLKDSGIKAKIVKQYIPVINKLMDKYLAALEFFVQFELDENFDEKIKSRHRDEFTYNSFSEGEKMRIDLSLLFTWRAVAKLRNSIATNLLIMDEVFDSSLDNTGTDEFLKLITQLASDSNVFVISHKGDQLYDKFHSNIKFEKIKNFSHIAS